MRSLPSHPSQAQTKIFQTLNLIQDRQLRENLIDLAIAHELRQKWQRKLRCLIRQNTSREFLWIKHEAIVPLNERAQGLELSEALVRLHSAKAEVMPEAFLEHVRSSPLLSRQLDRRVVIEVLRELGKAPGRGAAINLSAASVVDLEFPLFVCHSLLEAGARAGQIIFEITEYQQFDLAIARQVLGELAAMGCEIALDDFAQGASGLHHLSLPLHWIKIDGSITKRITEPEYRAIARDVVAVAARRNLKIVAEWVETADQVAIVQELADEVAIGVWGQGRWFERG